MTGVKFFEQDPKSELPLIGWVCTYTPEEIIYAAGFYPFRLVENNPSTKLADTYLHHNLCPYVRSCLDSELRMEEKQLKGVVMLILAMPCAVSIISGETMFPRPPSSIL